VTELDVAALRASYARFLDGDPGSAGARRVLLTGHSHQAWPDVVRDALTRCFDDAARFVDDKWSAAVMPKVDAVGRAILRRSGFAEDDAIAFGRSTHELVFRLITCLPACGRGQRIVTTRGEFYSLHRQLTRLAEDGADVVWVAASPREGLAERLIDAITPGTAMVAFSAVLFEDAHVLPRLGDVIARAAEVGAIPLVDAYHAFNVVPLDMGPRAQDAYVTAGGYKYAEFGEGLCWLRLPADCALRPVDTGWFSDFGNLTGPRAKEVVYGAKGDRFAGATFDPTPFYRAEATLAHLDRFGLGPAELRAISLRQTRRLLDELDARGLGERVLASRDDARRGGFVSVDVGDGAAVAQRMRADGVWVDARGRVVRLGPAPYTTDDELARGAAALARAVA
jgi:selenocysteine lyase/cysteine desulfurase